MIVVKDYAALKLIDPTMGILSTSVVIKNPQAIHYIDCSLLTGYEWVRLLKHPQFEDLCTEYGGWAKMDRVDWGYLLRFRPQLKKYRVLDNKINYVTTRRFNV